MYASQTQSKKSREMLKTYRNCLRVENLQEQLYQKHFKKFYAGKPTRKYLQLMEKIEKAESITYQEIERNVKNAF